MKTGRLRACGPGHSARPHYPLSGERTPNQALPQRFRRPRLLIVGAGDVGIRLAQQIAAGPGARLRVYACTRDAQRQATLRRLGIVPLAIDLDQRRSLGRLHGLARWLVDLAPPPGHGRHDPRSRALRSVICRPMRAGRAASRRSRRARGPLAQRAPQRWVYVSTTGVYGDCGGALFDETRTPRPASARAVRRLAAETTWRDAARGHGARLAILRAPGIYAADRLPRERLLRGTPALLATQDVYTNHVHADDLAGLCLTALLRGRSNRVYHAVDDNELLMGDYFDRVADTLSLPRPPRLSRAQIADVISPANLSFMSESRRLSNHRLRRELRYRLRYPTLADTLASLPSPIKPPTPS